MTLIALTPSTLDDIPSLRHHLRFQKDVAAPAGRVFEVLATGGVAGEPAQHLVQGDPLVPAARRAARGHPRVATCSPAPRKVHV